MTIFKSNKNKKIERKKVLGAYLPLSLVQYLTLYCLAEGVSTSSIIEEKLMEWKEIIGISEDYWITEIVNRAIKEFKNQKNSLSTFLHIVERELKAKGLKDYIIQKILKSIENETQK